MALPTPKGRQSDVVYLRGTGHQVVLGTAGTGKTVMAMLRAIHLGSPTTPGSGPVLLVTYNKTLVTYLEHLKPSDVANVTIETYGKFARGYLNSRGLMPYRGGIAAPDQRRILIKKSIEAVAATYKPSKFFERDVGFFADELEWLAGMGLTSLDDYRESERHGRKNPLSSAHREATWKILEVYRELRDDEGFKYDWSDIASTAREQLTSDNGMRRYRHVVIDEGQDLSPEAIRSLVQAANPSGSVTFFGDYAQQIYGQDLSWRACGLQVRRVELFQDNYRNTAEIARLAIAMSQMPHFGGDPADLVEPREPTAAGPRPTLVPCSGEAEEVRVVQQLARDLGKSGMVAVLARTWADARRACRGLPAVKLHRNMPIWDTAPGIYCGAYHSAKGLEFDAVLLPFCGATHMPHADVIRAFGDDEAAARESRLLYVGVTRARTELAVTYSGTLTQLLPRNDALWVEATP